MKVMRSAAAATPRPSAVPEDVGHTPWSQRVRSLLLGPHGGGTTRRRASDVVRVGLAILLVVICVPSRRRTRRLEIHITELIIPRQRVSCWRHRLWFGGAVASSMTVVLIGLLVRC